MAMADLASNANITAISLTEISSRQNISLAYLEQIFLKLKNNKLVKSSRGANGGYVLEKPASEKDSIRTSIGNGIGKIRSNLFSVLFPSDSESS